MKPEKQTSPLENNILEPVLQKYDHLPVSHHREKLRQEIHKHPNFVLIGETGSGKSTCFSLLLHEYAEQNGFSGTVAVTQPRRIAASSLTEFVSTMVGSEVGGKVGYHIRFEDITSEDTALTFMTDGILLRKIQFDPLLLDYSVVMVDEAHEQTTNIILSLGLLKEVNKRRAEADIQPLRIVVTSATIERNRFADYIGDGDVDNSVAIEGKMYPVEVFYEKEIPLGFDFKKAAAKKVKTIVESGEPGDILIFMPGKAEISDTIEYLKDLVKEEIEILPLHAEQSPEDQNKIFANSGLRKVIVATNIAETSVTIDGIIHVIDSGLIKQTQFIPRSGIEKLVLTEHAISGIDQRKGRAGRTAPGFCYRLFTESSLKRRPQYQTSEILRSDLSQVILAMKKVGIEDIEAFDFLDKPRVELISKAISTLTGLGALDQDGHITEIGEQLVELALEPRRGRMIIEALKPELDCLNEITIIASLLEGKNIFTYPQEEDLRFLADNAHRRFFESAESDFDVLLNIWKEYSAHGYNDDWAKNNYLNDKALTEAKNVRLDLLEVLANHNIIVDPETIPRISNQNVSKALLAGLIDNLLVIENDKKSKENREYYRKFDRTKSHIRIHFNSILNHFHSKSVYILPSEIFINPKGNTYASNCLEVKREWLREYYPELFPKKQKTRPKHSKNAGKNGYKNNSH